MNPVATSPTETAAFPISFAQRRLWLIEQLQPGTAVYNLPIAWRLQGPLDHAVFERALNEIIRRHGSLRTTFRMNEDQPEQLISPFRPLSIPTVHLSSHADAEAEARRLIDAEVALPFDLERGPLIRPKLLRLSATDHLFVFNAHHILWDGWSITVFRNEFTQLYTAFCDSQPSPLPELPMQYADMAATQQALPSEASWKEDLDYWKQQLRGPRPKLEFPVDHPINGTSSLIGAAEICQIDAALIDALRSLSRKNGATLFMTLLAAFKALLHRYTGQEDIIVGSPVGGRDAAGSEDLIGFFVNTVALRTKVSGDPTFLEFLSRVKHVTLEAYAHQEAPFDRVIQELQPDRNLADQDPLIQVVMGFEGGAVQEWTMGSVRASVMDINKVFSKFDWTFLLEETDGSVRARLEYRTDLFETATIKQFLSHYRILLRGIVENPQRRLSEFPLLSETDRQQILVDWNQTSTNYERDRCVHELFEAQAAENPDAIALTFGKQQMTYAKLNALSARMAVQLQESGVAPGALVGLCLERSFEMIVAMLGILKAGAAYLPLDRSYPRERQALILEDTAVMIVVADAGFDASVLPNKNTRVLRVDCTDVAEEASKLIPSSANAEDLAYVMYTSGSTGVPKGVPVSHRGIVRLVRNTNYATFRRNDVFLQAAPISFDASTLEIWGCLLNGGRLVLAPPHALTLAELGEIISQNRITTLWLTAGLFHQMVDNQIEDLKSVRQLLAGGDVLSVAHVLKAIRELPGCQLINGYGPTENTTFTCCYRIPANWRGGRSVPIGKPISNTQVYILDNSLAPVPIGIAGELCIGGDGLARGYWKSPALTAERFVPHPFPSGNSDVIYKTGDAARYLPDGNIEFLGRKDQQVKIRGFRIELGEIETTMGLYPAVAECAVAARRPAGGESQLVAYFVAADRRPFDIGQLRRFLEEKLPPYMVPSHFVQLPALPLTANGKLDRNALPEPGVERPERHKKYASPRNEIEVELTRIWENCLGVRPIGIEDKFFELGGHSLTAVRVIAQIEKAFGRKLQYATLFQAPTIEQLAAILREQIDEEKTSKENSIVEICSRGTGTPLFLVHGAGGGMFWGYVNLSRHLGPEQPVYGFRSRGLAGKEEFPRLEDMAAQYVADMRQIQPHGPYQLGGYCFGGNVAYEMARQLSAQQEEVSVLALINCSPPNTSYDRFVCTPIWFLRFLKNLCSLAGDFRRLTPAQRQGFFRWKYRRMKQILAPHLRFTSPGSASVVAENRVDLSGFSVEQQKLWQTHIQAQSQYHPLPYPGQVHLFRSPGHSALCSFDSTYGWNDLAEKGVEVFVVSAGHEKILEEPYVQAVAAPLKKLLQAKSKKPLSRAPAPQSLAPAW